MGFKERFGQLVKDSGMKGKDIAKGIGISAAEVSKLLKYDREPSAYTLKSISKFFDVSVDWLLELSDTSSIKPVRRAECKKLGLSERAIDVLVEEAKRKNKMLSCFKLQGVNMLFEQVEMVAEEDWSILSGLGRLAELINDDVVVSVAGDNSIELKKAQTPTINGNELLKDYYISKYIDYICAGLKQLCEQKSNIDKDKVPEIRF